jgi:predicted amidohydrolase
VKVAAYQSPLAGCGTTEALTAIREQVDRCESLGVAILCCPEGVLGGLADYSSRPTDIAIDVDGGQLHDVLAPLESDTVTTILGFTEIDGAGRLYNAAAVFQRGTVVGLYRKLHPAINRSVYAAGHETPVFTVGALTFGIVICRDSVHPEPARVMASRGAAALFVPTNNGMPPAKGGPELVAEARAGDIARARELGVSVIRADVAGRTPDLVSYGSSGIVDRDGTVLGSARELDAELIVAEIDVTPRGRDMHQLRR